jgi:hypothetical protein
MSRITVDNVAAAIRKVHAMSVREKEALADEIHLHQPHLLASCLVQSRLGVDQAAVEFLLNILFVCYQSMKESGLQWSVITEEEQERQMQRWIGAVQFSEQAAGSATDGAREQRCTAAGNVVSQTDRWLREISERNADGQRDFRA